MKVFYQLSTHWDREWYRPFQGFRYYLTEMIDGLIKALENDDIDVFSFDGQTIVIDDYLEIRSENTEKIKKMIMDGKIKIGPWYVMPDELIVSGESLVENFLVGHNTAEKYNTKAWKFGYMNDIFGHTAQMPQILNGFGIKGAFLGRGAGNERQFVWEAPDGSECFVFNYNYSHIKRRFDVAEDKKTLLTDYIAEHEIPVVIINYTDDHAKITEDTIKFKKILSTLPYNISEGLEKYEYEIVKYYDKLPHKRGELIETARTIDDFRAVTNSISSYYPLKKENDICEKLLYNKLAPMIVMGEYYGFSGNRSFFDKARKYLLKNQSHDSICGCSVDEVHRNMPYRYNQVKEIVEVINEEFFAKVCCKTKESSGEYFLYVYNFGLYNRDGVITIDIDFPKEWETIFTTNALARKENMFKIVDEEGNNVEYQLLHTNAEGVKYDRQDSIFVFTHTIAMKTKLKSFGATKFKIMPNDILNIEPEFYSPAELKAENEYLELNISETGVISIKNKQTGKLYNKLNTYIEDSDAGNGWFYEPAARDAQMISCCGGEVEIINKGKLLNSFRIISYMNVPSSGNRNKFSRSKEYKKMKISTTITLRAGDKKVEFETIINNNVKDHRVRVFFPSGIVGETYSASQAFCFNERKRGITKEGINSREPEMCEKNTSGIIGVSDNIDSLYFIGKNGFHEGGVYPDGTISVTMFRGFGYAFHEPETIDAQINGVMKFNYALSVSDEGLFEEQLNLSNKLECVLCKCADIHAKSLINMDNKEIMVSVIKPAENKKGWIIRLFNPKKEKVSAELKINMNVNSVYETNMAEEIEREIAFCENSIKLNFEPYKVKTYYFEI